MDRIICNSPVEFLKSITSNVELSLTSTTYDISDICISFDPNVFYIDTDVGPYGDRELLIRDIHNLCLHGADDTQIINKYQYANIITFENCSNITLDSLSFGHFPEMGSCKGGVLVFRGCKNVTIRNCTMFGCGTIGLTIIGCENIHIDSGTITKCNSELLYVDESIDCFFESMCVEHNETRSLMILHSNNIRFTNCKFTDNTNAEWDTENTPLFYIGNSSGEVVLESSVFDVPRELLVNAEDRLTFIE